MKLDEFKQLIINDANVLARISYGKIKRIFLIANELGYDDTKIQALVSQLSTFYGLQNDIHEIDLKMPYVLEKVARESLKTDRYNKIMAVNTVMEQIPRTVGQYLVISIA